MNEEKEGAAAPESDAISQLKGEFTRKFNKTEEAMQGMAEQNRLLMQQLNNLTQSKTAPPAEDDLESILISDPKKYAAIVKQQAKNEALAEMRSENARNQGVSSVINSLTNEYPELSDTNSDMYKKAVENYGKMSPEYQSSPLSYKLAVREAADELNIKPRSKRPQEDFVGSSGGSRPRRSKELDSSVLEFAEKLGLKTQDPEVKKRLQQRSEQALGEWSQKARGNK